MVLRKERIPSETGISNSKMASSANEQPVIKRQRIENSSENGEIIDQGNDEHGTSSHSQSSSSSSTTSPSPSLIQYEENGSDELDRATVIIQTVEIPTLTTISSSSTSLPSSQSPSNSPTQQLNANESEMGIFQNYLMKQCLCCVSERTLRKPFQSHYKQDSNGTKRVATLTEWPQSKLLQFLSNLQLLFEIYFKQTQKRAICARIMDVCEALIGNEHNLIDEIIDLCEYNNKFVTFLAGRVLSSFLVISKIKMNNNWLKKIVNNLFLFETLDFTAVRKISFSLDIIKRIVEWQDFEEHPLDEIVEDDEENIERGGGHGAVGGIHFHPQTPLLESNYFAQCFRNANGDSSSSSSSSNTEGSISLFNIQSSSTTPSNASSHSSSTITPTSLSECQIVTPKDHEIFDTVHLKCLTIKFLENKWPALVKNMSTLILSRHDMSTSENCIITFLSLWESIISVRANLSVVETLPFYAQLDKFEILLSQNVSSTIYKQMLTLFNEALCYGSTLALQDLIPEETCSLAHQIVHHVQDFRILDSLPRRHTENPVGLIEYIGRPVQYGNEFHAIGETTTAQFESVDMDKTLLQKVVLLVLKSVAVTVKEIRSDSSDSSIDSTDYEAFQDMVLIERSIRDVLKKLETFIKSKLHFHPESHFSKILIHLFDDQDDYLIEAMVCTLDVTAAISFRNNAFPELVAMLNPVYTFLEFLEMTSNSYDLLLDLLVSNETCFLLYLLRFLKYIRINWSLFVQSCANCGMGHNVLDSSMAVLTQLRKEISNLVARSLYPYDISPILRLLESCESLHAGNELS